MTNTRWHRRAAWLAVAAVAIGVAWWAFQLRGTTPSSADERRTPTSAIKPAASQPGDSSSQTGGAVLVSAGDIGAPTDLPSGLVPTSRRARAATIAPAWLDRKRSPWFESHPADAVMMLELFPGDDVAVRLLGSSVVGQDRHVVRGVVDGMPDSRFLLSVSGDAVAFSLRLDDGRVYGGVPLEDGRIAIYELDAAAGPPCATPLPALPDADALAVNNARPFAVRTGAMIAPLVGQSASASTPPTAADVPLTAAQVDVLVLYTPEVLASSIPDAALIAKADLAIAEANDDYSRSETRVQLRLVGLRQTNYTETGSNSTALDRLRQTSDGYMDEVHAERDQLGADLVCLLVQRSDPQNIGIAYVLDSIADPDRYYNDIFAFSVVQYAWFTGSNTFSHELGHNFGCAHDRENSSSPGVFSYSYGYRFTGADSRTYRTIMAYQPGTSVPYFSNPRLTHPVALRPLGIAAGLPGEADNVSSINRTAWFVASYRSNQTDPPARGRLYNVSTRAWVGTDDNVLIGGFYVGSPGPKEVLIRVRGPGLNNFGITDALPDPELELVNQSTGETMLLNDDWGAAANAAAITGTGLAPADAREPAMLVSLDPGGYTAIARGVNGSTGVALIEVFEIASGSAPKLINLSTRGYVGTGDHVMIGGVVVTGNPGETKRLLFRALGPSLADFGVTGTLSDPAMRLYNENSEELLDNDDWDYLNDTQQAQVRALGLAPAARVESVLLVDLPPGLYTLVVRPFENDSGIEPGVGLIEAYEITTP